VDGTKPHRFAELLPRELRRDDPGHVCAQCETAPAVFEGPQHPRNYEMPSRVIAAALMAVGTGDSYANASKTARRSARRAKRWPAASRKRPNRRGGNGTLVADWVGSFTSAVTGPVFESESWPEVVALDELTFGTTYATRGPGRRKLKTQWVVFGAYGHPRYGTGELFRLGVSGRLDHKAAAQWLTSIPGRPKYVVADGSKMWPKAVALAWPPVVDPATGEILEDTPRMLPCQYHLRQLLEQQLRAASIIPPRDAGAWRAPNSGPKRTGTGQRKELRVRAAEPGWYGQHSIALASYPDPGKHPLVVAAGRAFWSVERWDEMLALAVKWQANSVANWMARQGWVRDAIANHAPGLPKSIGGLENQLARVRTLLHDRRLVLRNQVRTQHLLDLMTLNQRGLANQDDYAARIRAHLSAHEGRPPLQRVGITGGAQLY
jgi:hypothetical protein